MEGLRSPTFYERFASSYKGQLLDLELSGFDHRHVLNDCLIWPRAGF